MENAGAVRVALPFVEAALEDVELMITEPVPLDSEPPTIFSEPFPLAERSVPVEPSKRTEPLKDPVEPLATALAVTDRVPAPQRALKNLGLLEVTDTATYPVFGAVTCDAEIVYPFCAPMAMAALRATVKLEPV